MSIKPWSLFGGGAFKAAAWRRSLERPMELLRMLALLAGTVGLLRHDLDLDEEDGD